jgi:hypothetical protein
MNRLRHAHLLVLAVLAWFVLTIGASVAAPVLKPSALESICSGSGGMVLIDHGGTPDKAASAHSLDCPLCASFSAPPSVAPVADLPIATQSLQAARPPLPRLVSSAGPQPARGPPLRT